jgi:hypothetical protein
MSQSFVFRPTLIAVALDEKKKHVGFEFEGTDGKLVFIALDGSWIPGLAKSLLDLVGKRPDVLSWTRPPSKLQ